GMAYYDASSPDGQQPPSRPTPPDLALHYSFLELIDAPCLRSLRTLTIGDQEAEPPEEGWCDCHTYIGGPEHVVGCMPRVEEIHLLCKGYESAPLFALSNLTNLRVLRMYHLGGYRRGRERYEYALDVLAANPALANLTHLLFHPHCAEGLGA